MQTGPSEGHLKGQAVVVDCLAIGFDVVTPRSSKKEESFETKSDKWPKSRTHAKRLSRRRSVFDYRISIVVVVVIMFAKFKQVGLRLGG